MPALSPPPVDSTATVRGMAWMVLATVVLTSMHAAVRHLGGQLHPFEVAFFRSLFGLVAILPLLLRAGLSTLRTRRPLMHAGRAVLGIMAMLSWFYGLSVVPIAEATALSFTVVIFGSVGAAVFLGERMRARRWSAAAMGFAGAMVILRPGVAAVDAGALLVLFSSLCWALAMLVVKRLVPSESTVAIVAWNSILLTALSAPVAATVWIWPDATQLGLLLLVGILGTCGHLAMTTALKLADATAILPVDFTRLLWASALGFVLFGEVPDLWVWIGGTVIFASTTYISYREAMVRREQG